MVLFPLSTLVMIIGTQECMEAPWSSPHVIVRFARSVMLLVMLPWRIKPRQVLENAGGVRRHGRRKLLGRIKRQLRWPANGALISTTDRNTSTDQNTSGRMTAQ